MPAAAVRGRPSRTAIRSSISTRWSDRKLLDAESLRGATTLNDFLSAGLPAWRAVRARLRQLIGPEASGEERAGIAACMLARDLVTMHLPVAIAITVDFYSSIEHATNLGSHPAPQRRTAAANYRHVPIGYHGAPHGRASGRRSGVRTGTAASRRERAGVRGRGDARRGVGDGWFAGPATRSVSRSRRRGSRARVRLRAAQRLERARHPSVGVSTARTVLGQIVRHVGLAVDRHARRARAVPVAEPARDPEPLPICAATSRGLRHELEMLLQTARMRERAQPPMSVSRTNFRAMYWTVAQQLAH